MALPNPTVRDWKGDKHKVMLSDSSVKIQKFLMELQLRAVVDLMRHVIGWPSFQTTYLLRKHLFAIFTLAKKDLKYS
ncbi:hypothetical protein BKA60DRAFT_474910 [Fusarium oxysporum]|nr:hypothetical protein BKA60DRAFT_474910 [Fusarium oxysporum]